MRNPLRRTCPSEVQDGLAALSRMRLSPSAVRSLSDYRLYAAIGRDRRKLTMEWVEQAYGEIEKANEWDRMLRESS